MQAIDWGNLRRTNLIIPVYIFMVILCALSWFLLYIDYSTTAHWYNALPIRKVVDDEGWYAGLIPLALTVVFGYLAFNHPHRRRLYFTIAFIAWAVDAYADIIYRVDTETFGMRSLLAGAVVGGAIVTLSGETLAVLTTSIVIDYLPDFLYMVSTAVSSLGNAAFAVDTPAHRNDQQPRPAQPPPSKPAASAPKPGPATGQKQPGGPVPFGKPGPSAGPGPSMGHGPAPSGLGTALLGGAPDSALQSR
jgi:hypothetical protein